MNLRRIACWVKGHDWYGYPATTYREGSTVFIYHCWRCGRGLKVTYYGDMP